MLHTMKTIAWPKSMMSGALSAPFNVPIYATIGTEHAGLKGLFAKNAKLSRKFVIFSLDFIVIFIYAYADVRPDSLSALVFHA